MMNRWKSFDIAKGLSHKTYFLGKLIYMSLLAKSKCRFIIVVFRGA